LVDQFPGFNDPTGLVEELEGLSEVCTDVSLSVSDGWPVFSIEYLFRKFVSEGFEDLDLLRAWQTP